MECLSGLDANVMVLILSYAGPRGTIVVSGSCKKMHRGPSRSSRRRLWRFFFEHDFFHLSFDTKCDLDAMVLQESITKSPRPESSHDCDDDDDWYGAYEYVAKVIQKENSIPEWLDTNCLFADDGGHIAGYPAQNALSHGPECWCTRPGVDRNVDLIAELDTPALVTAFRFGNPEAGYTMPLSEAIAIASFAPPDLSARRIFNHQENQAVYKNTEAILSGQNHNLPGTAGVRFDLDDLSLAARGGAKDITTMISCIPRLANFVHFKLLSSFHPDGQTVNMDVRHLHVAGFRLPYLHEYLASSLHTKCLQRIQTKHNYPPSYPARTRYHDYTGYSTIAGRDAIACYQRMHPDASPDHRPLRLGDHRPQRHNIHGVDHGLVHHYHHQDQESQLAEFRPDIIRMMIVTTDGLMTHMPIDILALHPPTLPASVTPPQQQQQQQQLYQQQGQ